MIQGMVVAVAFQIRRAFLLAARLSESIVKTGSTAKAIWFQFEIANWQGDRGSAASLAAACLSASGFNRLSKGRKIRILEAAGKHAEAVALGAAESDPFALLALARCQEKIGNNVEAFRLMEAASRLDPKSVSRRQMLMAKASSALRREFSDLPFAGLGMQVLIDEHHFLTVLDIGCGAGLHAEALARHGKKVTLCDYGKSIYFEKISARHQVMLGDFCEIDFQSSYDCIWASHVLEHQPDPGRFLRKCADLLNDKGIACITVPPLKPELVGGHVSLWTPGHLIYHLILAGFDCRQATVLRYGYNITVIAPKALRSLPPVAYDNGDIDRLSEFFPGTVREGADGWLENCWWQPAGA